MRGERSGVSKEGEGRVAGNRERGMCAGGEREGGNAWPLCVCVCVPLKQQEEPQRRQQQQQWLCGASKRPALELLSVSQRAVLTRSVRLFVCQGRLERPDLLRHNLELASVFEEKLGPPRTYPLRYCLQFFRTGDIRAEIGLGVSTTAGSHSVSSTGSAGQL